MNGLPRCVSKIRFRALILFITKVIRASTKEECEGFEAAAIWDVDHVIDRIMGGRKEMS